MSILKTVILFIIIILALENAQAQIHIKELTCEYKTNPLGIDASNPRLSWKIFTSEQNVIQTAYEVRVAETLDKLKKDSDLTWSSGKIESDKSVHVEYFGPSLISSQRVYWQVRVWTNKSKKCTVSTEAAFWEMGLMKPSDWKASFITPDMIEDTINMAPCPYLRKEFTLSKAVKSARVYVTSLGLYELQLNGSKVGDQVFTPGWTSYNKRLQYQVYDVTDQLSRGANALGAILGDGWYRGHIGWGKNNRNRYGKKLALLMQMEIIYQDDTKEMIISDSSWKSSTGPILFSDIYNGETYDSQLEHINWPRPDFPDESWKAVKELEHTKNTLIASEGEPVKKIQELKPKQLLITPKGEKVVDLGQNMTGWVRLKVKGQKGDKITLTFAEVLDKEGNFYTDNLRKAKCTDIYFLKGNHEEIFEPHFTFHGFRYVRVEGISEFLSTDNITGIVIHSDTKPIGTFICSDSLINQLQSNIQWGQKGNFLDVPTDCPQRDERLGWTGDAQVFAPTASFNFHVACFFTKWMKDIAADQMDNGAVPDVVPDILNLNGSHGWRSKKIGWTASTGWADVSVIIPWTMYLTYGDKKILEQQYESMKAWITYMKDRAGSDFKWDGDEHFGDWLAYQDPDGRDYAGAYTEKDLIATAYFAYSTSLLSEIATILGKQEDAVTYKELFENIRKAFQQEYITSTGRIISNTQTAYTLALAFDLIPDELEKDAARYLAENVKKFGHITTGFLGTPLICHVLTKTGYNDLAYLLLDRKQFPSWLYPVTAGATTIWERWDGKRPDGSFQSVKMNSFNHYAYGAIGDWLYKIVAGINIDRSYPGYKKILFYPQPESKITQAQAFLETMYGKTSSSWQITNGKFNYKIQVPPNTKAIVRLPGAGKKEVRVNGKPISSSTEIKNIRQENSDIVIETGSGEYTFLYNWK